MLEVQRVLGETQAESKIKVGCCKDTRDGGAPLFGVVLMGFKQGAE